LALADTRERARLHCAPRSVDCKAGAASWGRGTYDVCFPEPLPHLEMGSGSGKQADLLSGELF